eukprot:478574-Pyramimonas_sp.AAC.1
MWPQTARTGRGHERQRGGHEGQQCGHEGHAYGAKIGASERGPRRAYNAGATEGSDGATEGSNGAR